MSLRVPPPEIPVINFLSPNKSDQGAVEFWNTEVASYVPLDIGAPHPNQRQYPNFRLGKQSPVQGDEKWYIRIWVSDETNPDWFSWASKYAGEDNAFPTFIRTYREPRNSYTPRTKLTSLKTIYKLVVTDAGSGYTTGTYPKIVFDAPTVAPTTEATAHGVVAPDGTISECVLDFGGDGYAQDVEFNVDAPVNGNPARGIAYVQPQTAILTKEEASLFPEDSPFYAQYLQVVRVYETIPGPTFYETSLDIDGATLTTATTRKLCSDIQTGEAIDSGTWCKTTKKPTDIDVICEEVVACRLIPGIPMLSTTIDQNGDIMSQSKTMVEASSLVTTNVIFGGVWTKTFQQDIDGTSLVSWEVVQVRDTQNELDSFSVEIPDLIPLEFRATAPVTETGQTLIGDASLPTLAIGDLFREEKQLDDYTYRLTIRGRADISLPQTITNQELTEEYGGGVLNVTSTLDLFNNLTIDQGLLVVSSEVRKLDSQANGLAIKITKELDDTAWPVLNGTEVDPRTGIVIGIEKQVVDAGAVGGVSGSTYTDVKSIDKWRSITIASTLDPMTLPAPVSWETTVEHSFPNTLLAATWLWALATDDCCYSFDMALETEVDEGYSGPCRALVTESFTVGAPADTVTITQFFPKANTIGYAWAVTAPSEDCKLCQASARTWSLPPTLHDEITIAGSVILDNGTFTSTIPATDPIGLPAPGTLITKDVSVERWRFGVFFRRVTEIYVPG